jgi:hypothetical protein
MIRSEIKGQVPSSRIKEQAEEKEILDKGGDERAITLHT